MSRHTLCNHCKLQTIVANAEKRGAGVYTARHHEGDMPGWIAVHVSDQSEPVAYFQELTDHCACG